MSVGQLTPGIMSQYHLLPVKGMVIGNRHLFPRVADLIESVTYKPGYQLVLDIPNQASIEGRTLLGQTSAVLRIKCFLPDSTRAPHEATLIESVTYVSEYVEGYPDDHLRYWLRKILATLEYHEIDEWFRIDGKLVNDPHAQKK